MLDSTVIAADKLSDMELVGVGGPVASGPGQFAVTKGSMNSTLNSTGKFQAM